MPQTPTCPHCNGTGHGDVIDHGFAHPPKPATATSYTDMEYSERVSRLAVSAASWRGDMERAAELCGQREDEYPMQAVERRCREYQTLLRLARFVCDLDWSENDEDAVQRIADLRAVTIET